MTRRAALLASLVVSLGGCEFAQIEQPGPSEVNSCAGADDCGSSGQCVDGLCVASAAEEPLSVLLEVTPARTEDDTPLHTLLLRPMRVEAPMDEPIEVPRSDELRGKVRDKDGAGLEAEVRFTPLAALPGLVDPSIALTTSAFSINNEYDFRVSLSRGVDYRMTVRPADPAYPPYRTTLRAGGTEPISVNYKTLAVQDRLFRISGGPSEAECGVTPAPSTCTLIARAFDAATGEPVSSSAAVTDGEVSLTFTQDAPPWRLEVRAEQSYEPVHSVERDGLGCDEDTPIYPLFSVPQDLLTTADDGALEVSLPEPPPRIRYEGTVAPCPGEDATTELPMTLNSESLLLEDAGGVSAAFEATTTVRYDAESGSMRFCVQLMEGEYDVVVTPPSGSGCGLFAERRLIKAPDDKAATGALLELERSAWLQGRLKTRDLEPLADATVDAIALARAAGVELAEDDPSVTRYNRSQQTTTDASGAFRLAVDLGSYDVVVKAPAGSGYPWQIRHDVGIGARGVEFPTVIDMVAPLTLAGTLRFQGEEDQPEAFADAEVSAFAILDQGEPTERAVAIGKTTADATGRFMLLLPPSLQRGW